MWCEQLVFSHYSGHLFVLMKSVALRIARLQNRGGGGDCKIHAPLQRMHSLYIKRT